MSKGLEINVEVGLCTKEMAKENPIKDFEILIEEYKDKWSKQMYDYFKECLNEIKKKENILEIIKKYGHFDFYTGELIVNVPNDKEEEYNSLKEVLS